MAGDSTVTGQWQFKLMGDVTGNDGCKGRVTRGERDLRRASLANSQCVHSRSSILFGPVVGHISATKPDLLGGPRHSSLRVKPIPRVHDRRHCISTLGDPGSNHRDIGRGRGGGCGVVDWSGRSTVLLCWITRGRVVAISRLRRSLASSSTEESA